MVTAVCYGDNKQADLWLRNKHKRCQAAPVVQLKGLVVVGRRAAKVRS